MFVPILTFTSLKVLLSYIFNKALLLHWIRLFTVRHEFHNDLLFMNLAVSKRH